MGGFVDVGGTAGVDNDLDGRGVALVDFDNDGRIDIYQTSADQPTLLYRNVSDAGNWIEFELRGTKSNRFGIGARIVVEAGGYEQIREIDGGNGYASQSAKRAHFGLGSALTVKRVEIHWPSGTVDSIDVAINDCYVANEGKGVILKGKSP